MKCSFCSKEAVYLRKYEGHRFCGKHFTKSIEKKVKRTLGSNNLIEKGDRVAVACSGGKDSANLLFLLNKIFRKNPNVELFVITVDEGIKGYRDRCLEKSESLCDDLKIGQHTFSFKEEFGLTVDELANKMESGYCGSCGLLRRYLLNKKARELGATKVATGHNLNDECESIMMNVLRGDLLRLARIGPSPRIAKHPKFVQRVKPLMEIPEDESILFGKINKLPSHPKKCPYSEDNTLRMEARRFIKRLEEGSPGIKYSLYESARKIGPSMRKRFEAGEIRTCEECGEPTSQETCEVCKLISRFKK